MNKIYNEVKERLRAKDGFIAALDSSGGSTPKVLSDYGVDIEGLSKEDMSTTIHQYRTRVMTAPEFSKDKILGAILFNDTVSRDVDGRSAVTYLTEKGIASFLKIDNGLTKLFSGVQKLDSIPGLFKNIYNARRDGIVGIKARSVIHNANPSGIATVVNQQFQVANASFEVGGMIPIIEPEVLITASNKRDAESILRAQLLEALDSLDHGHDVILKLTLPTEDDFYHELSEHPRVLAVAALSGGYLQEDACRMLSRNKDTIASFSRALLEGLSIDQDIMDFNETLTDSIHNIYYSQTRT